MQDCPGPDIACGQQKIQYQQENAQKQAGQKRKQAHDQKASAKAALIYTWTTFKQHFENKHPGDPWVAQRFGACLWPRARSWRPGIESHIGLPVHGACFSLCLCLCLSFSLCDYHK
ncbi:unnamed protein product [Nyctereutes procyonoides]|uniref:(raccoon dog) hypothetical protein n=1 Tax=Nyctereutes procyonoides TaxID=34880 RepID=A0A811ZRM1_NYCPR|nr:unnamed protein product [Nyctereutes procyonoides]